MRFALAVLGVALALAVLVWVAVVGPARSDGAEEPAHAPPPLALFTSLPIYWPEAGDVSALLNASERQHWARLALERRWALQPLDTLTGDGGLGGHRNLLMAQPRPLTPAENVALDAWVGAGGRLLLFADPALTAESAFALGDPRRPQDLVLLSPILARWGLELTYDSRQPLGGEELRLENGARLPVRLAGRFALLESGRGACRLSQEATVARCRIGEGRLTAVADAALFEPAADEADERGRRQREAMRRLRARKATKYV